MVMDTISRLNGLPDVLIIDRPVFSDDRGFFREYLRLNELEAAVGRPIRFVQANHSRSRRGVLRGIHVADYDKLVYVPAGEVLAVIVDLRPASETFKRFERLTLGEGNRQTLFLPPGFGNAYYVTSEQADYTYLVSANYDPKREQQVRWDDPDLAIPWPDKRPVISERDRQGYTVRELFPKIFG